MLNGTLQRKKKKRHLLALMAVLSSHLLTTLEITDYCKSITIFLSDGYLIHIFKKCMHCQMRVMCFPADS